MAAGRDKRRLTAIFAADVVGYSRLIGADETGTRAALRAHRSEVTDPKITEHEGRIVSTAGDSILAEFNSVVDAVECAAGIQRAMALRNEAVSEDKRIEFRIGINLGDIIVEGDDIHGDGVNIAARLESLADPGGVFISGSAFDQVRNKLELGFEDLGERQVKNIADPVRTYRVLLDARSAGTITPAPSRHQTRTRWIFAAISLVAIVIGGGAIWNFAIRETLPRIEAASLERMAFPLPDKPSLAVLAFDNLAGDPDEDYFVDGFVDDIITDLSHISALFVMSREATFAFKGRPVRIRDVAEELGVRFVLDGGIRRAEGTIQVNARLIDAVSGKTLWAENFDADAGGVFTLQDEIYSKVVTGLAVEVTAKERSDAQRGETDNAQAYDAYLQGQEYLERFTPQDLRLANEFLRKAVELDPGYSRAIALLTGAYSVAFQRGWHQEVGAKSSEEVLSTFERLLEIALKDPTALAYHLDATLASRNQDQARALTQMERALALSPSNAETIFDLANLNIWAGKPEEALAGFKKAQRLQPTLINNYLRGVAQFTLEKYDVAAASFEAYRDEAANSPGAAEMLTATYAQLGRQEEMRAARREWFEPSQKRTGRSPTISATMRSFPFSKAEDRERLVNAFLKAGVPR